jgi:hypothetical protein
MVMVMSDGEAAKTGRHIAILGEWFVRLVSLVYFV